MDAKIEDGIYYEKGQPKHAGVVKVEGEIYYAGSDGILATGEKIVHREMGNGILKRGTYRFGEDGKLIKGSYIPPKKSSGSKDKADGKRRLPLSKKGRMGLILGFACLLLLFILAELHYGWLEPKVDLSAAPAAVDAAPEVVLPSFTEEQYLCTESMLSFYRGESSLLRAINAKQGAYAPLAFPYQIPSGAEATLTFDGVRYELDPEQNVLFLDNLMTGRTYDYTVEVTLPLEGGAPARYQGSVTTAATNRFILLPGVKNTRDIGGYTTLDGKRVKQGLLIRGTELDGLVESDLFLTDKDAAAAFGFKTELDLRNREIFSGDYKSRLGENVSHRFCNAPQYGEIYSEQAWPRLKEIFSALADANNYPLYLNCTHGADRTGTVVYLLQAVLGISDEDKELEYRLSGFTFPYYGVNTELNGIFGGLDSLPGDTINEKICGFLTRDVGVTEAQLDSIRAILLEEP